MPGEGTKFTGEITVAARIIDYLSSGLYRNPAACLKELVNNAYDADASTVRIYVKPDADRIIIEDDGSGMTREEFVSHFSRISESHKRDGSEATKSGRPKVGKIGIGFIAANELCEVIELFSTKAGSADLLHVTIDFSELKKPIEQRRRPGGIFKAGYEGTVTETAKADHYTRLFLRGVKGGAKGILAGARAQVKNRDARSLYGLNAKSVETELKKPELKTWKDFDTYSETMLRVALNVPVQYHANWMPARFRKRVASFEKAVKKLDFSVSYDNTELRKPIVFSPHGRSLIVPFKHVGKNVSARGYFYAQHGIVRPIELQGVMIRVRNAGVGEYDSSFLGFPQSEFSLIQRWVSGEVWADDRLEEAMNIDRSTLRETHPAYVELRTTIHEALRKVFSRARKNIYSVESDIRRDSEVQKQAKNLALTVSESASVLGPKVASNLKRAWARTAKRPTERDQLLKRYQISELYEVVIQAAKEVLDRRQMGRFLDELTRRLRQ